MQSTDSKRVVRNEANVESAAAGLWLRGLGELDTGGFVSVYRGEGYGYKF
jgi:hypothetical protein